MERRQHRVERVEFEGARLRGVARADVSDRDQKLPMPKVQQRIVGFGAQRLAD